MDLDGKKLLREAEDIFEDLTAYRRQLHQNPETGPHLPQTTDYVRNQLLALGYEPREICDSGLVAGITGEDTGRCILLRADMDALPVTEQSGLPFAAENGRMHACGHDMHTAMLLGAAKLLRKHQQELKGTVKLVFQPDEEGFTGAKTMLAAGVLRDPAPQVGMALHVNSGTPSGLVICGRGTFMAGCTLFRITVRGTGCHGAMPETGVDPILVAAQILLALQELPAREVGAKTPAVVTVGRFSAGQVPNVIPESAVLEGTIRTMDRELAAHLYDRIEAISAAIATAFRATAVTEELASAPPLKNDPSLVDEMARLAGELFGTQMVYSLDEGGMGSEDFASYTYELPCAYLLLGAGTPAEDPRYGKPMHNEAVVFNESVLARGAALHTYCALKWLSEGTTGA